MTRYAVTPDANLLVPVRHNLGTEDLIVAAFAADGTTRAVPMVHYIDPDNIDVMVTPDTVALEVTPDLDPAPAIGLGADTAAGG